MGCDPAVSKAAELMFQGKMHSADEIRCGGEGGGGGGGKGPWRGYKL